MKTVLAAACVVVLSSLSVAQIAPPGADATLPERWLGPGPLHKFLVGADEPGLAGALRDSGAVRRELDYGAFTLFLVDEAPLGGRAALDGAGLPIHDEQDLIPANGWLLDGSHPKATLAALPPNLRMGGMPGRLDPAAGLYLVQFEGPILDRWRDALDGAGVEVVQYVSSNAYVVAAQPDEVPALLALRDGVQYVGEWQPAFRLTPAVRAAAQAGGETAVPVTVQFVDGPGAQELIDALASVATWTAPPEPSGPYLNVAAVLAPELLVPLARQPQVFAIEMRGVRTRFDERQGQILAGSISGANVVLGSGYLAWLASAGFNSSQFGSFSVDVVDDALTLTGHPDLPSARVAFTQNPTGQSGQQGGHGFLNANIVAGFNSGTGSSVEDAGAFNYGLGIAPWSLVGSTAIFGNGNATPTSWENTAYGLGARISTNSWGFTDQFGNPIADYDSNSQEYDRIVRDARNGDAGNQEYAVVFAAGNQGPTTNTVASPGTAKNVITVGASENDRQTGTDGCLVGNSGANDVRDLINFTSHGPVNSAGGDGRWKPEIVAPGTHIEAGVPQSNYDGSSICNKFFPSGQTLYGWSSGTSHSTPAVAGGAALVRQWFLNHALSAPSPAMTKAVLANGADYMTGAFANDTLPSNAQGMGRMDVATSFASVSRVLIDQTQLLASTGATWTTTGNVPDATKPFRVSLSWTDAPGPTTGAPWVNNLDLTVTVGGTTYKGNVFSGASSVAGGSADGKNNTESVFLPAGTSGAFTITVTAANIAGDGVPGNGDTTDQDFALVAWNATAGPAPPVADFSGTPLTGIKPLNVAFTDATTGSVTSWSWTFGDGGTSTSQSPSHAYTNAGTYTVALTATGPGGSNTKTKTGYVVVSEPAPVADFSGTPTSGLKPLGVTFTDLTSGGPVTSWSWTFGDGGTSTLQNPSHTYTNAGTFSVALTATGPGGANTKTKTGYIVVNEPPPVADFSGTPTSGIKPLTVNFSNLSSGGPVTTWAWTFGDGGTSSAQSPSHTYTSAGTFTVALTATGPGGSNTKTKTSYIVVSEPAPVADFSGTPTTGIKPLSVSFTDLTSGGPVSSWSWTFGDGGTSAAQSPSHVYLAAGSYTVALTATGPGGSSTKTKTAYIVVSEQAPVADFSGTPTSGIKPLTVNFSDLSSGGPVTNWSWTFGDGGTSSAQNPSHVYALAGSYTVSLTATGPGGSNTKTKVGYVVVGEPAPIADFSGTPTSGTKPLLVSFSDLSSGPVTSWAWDFGDGGTSALQNPSHTYTSAGTFTVSLTATGPGGSDLETKTAYITVGEPAPIANFSGTPTSGAAPLLVSFSDLSSGPVTSWAWDFGDGGTSSAQNPSHSYVTGGNFTVSLTVTGPGGSDSKVLTAYVTVSSGSFVAYGSGTGGFFGVPSLAGSGDLTPGGTGFTLQLGNAAPTAPATLLVGLSSASLPVKGQTLALFPILLEVSLGSTNGSGALTLPAAMPAGTPSVSVFTQFWISDATGPHGFTSSNGLELQIP